MNRESRLIKIVIGILYNNKQNVSEIYHPVQQLYFYYWDTFIYCTMNYIPKLCVDLFGIYLMLVKNLKTVCLF